MAGATASPSVRHLAGNLGVDIDALAARLGRIVTREDVLAASGGTASFASAPSQSTASLWDVDHSQWGPVRSEPLSKFARLSAANLSAAAAAIPSVTHHETADATRIEATRAALRAKGIKITALAFHVAVLARCLREFPRFNASLAPSGGALVLKDYVHIGIAVDTSYGLIVPVIRDADTKTVGAIGTEIADLAARAKDRKIRPAELGGASMSVTNLGGIGGEGFTPIVNPPEVAILGITRTEMRPVWDGAAFQPRPMVPLDLTYDHRVVNGADAARFMARYRALFADPDELLLPRKDTA
jgi:pyruvate dehydrogenase E2 component (dihydrolipoamide acetyltransferase)